MTLSLSTRTHLCTACEASMLPACDFLYFSLDIMSIGSSFVPGGALFLISLHRGHLHHDKKGSQTWMKTLQTPQKQTRSTSDLLFAETTIPVPRRVRRVVKRQWDFWIVMDYIPGPTLAHVWPALSTWQKTRVAFTLCRQCRYVRQLRRLKVSATKPPAPLSAQGARIWICESPMVMYLQPSFGRKSLSHRVIASSVQSVESGPVLLTFAVRCHPVSLLYLPTIPT
jgi:hypothetical protein